MEKILLSLIGMLCMFALTAPSAFADGFIIPIRPPDVVRVPPLAIKYHRVSVEITDQVARTTVDQVFLNDFHRDLEGTYIFPLPKGANVTEFAMYINGERISGELLEKEKARKIYQDIVNQMKDPALLEYLDRDLFKIRVYPIPAHGEKRIQLEYSEILTNDGGMVRYHYPLDTERFSSRPLKDVRIDVKLHAQESLKSIYSPSHDVAVDRSGDHRARISYEETHVVPKKDFVLYYTLSDKEIGANLLTYKQTRRDGYFMLMLSPAYELSQEKIQAKDIVFVLDTSGSMRSDNKLRQAQDALLYGLEGLSPQDRFGVVTFSTTVNVFDDALHSGSREQIGQAAQFIKQLRARGGTDIYEAVKSALAFFDTDADRPQMIVFLTDGRPTVGLTDYREILTKLERRNTRRRIFSFGVGYDVNTHLLDALSQQSKAASAYIEPFEDLELIVSTFFDKIDAPVLSDLNLKLAGAGVFDLFPKELPDLFHGSQLLVLGRYRTPGTFALELSGRVEGASQRFRYDVELPRTGLQHDFLPRLWANRKVGYLLDQIRLHGEEAELKEEVITLAKKFGILTPYTSYLVTEDEELDADARRPLFHDRAAAPQQEEQNVARGLYQMDKAGAPTLSRSFTESKEGKTAVRASKDVNKMKRQSVVGKAASQEIRYLGSKTFYLLDNVWIDSEYEETRKTVELVYGSDAYFALLNAIPDLGQYLALGEALILCRNDDVCLKIGTDGIETSDDPRFKALLQIIK